MKSWTHSARWVGGLGVATSLCLPPLAAAPASLIENGGFDFGASHWTLHGEVRLDEADGPQGAGPALRIGAGWARQDLVRADLEPGATFTCAARYRLDQVDAQAEPGYAFLAVYQLDDFDDAVTSQDFVQATGTCDWQFARHTFTVVPHARTVSIRCGLFRAEGVAWFDDFTLTAGPEPLRFGELAERERAAAHRLGLLAGARGSVAIFKDDLPASGAAASPAVIAATLRQAGFATAFLSAADLADPLHLNPRFVDVLMLPYGASFPAAAAGNLRRFLRGRGKLFSTGGYAFDELWERTDTGWQPPTSEVTPEPDHALWRYEFPASRLRGRGPLTFTGWLKAAHVAGPGMAYFAIYQHDAAGRLPAWRDLCQVRGTRDWQPYRYTFELHPEVARVDVRAGLYRCSGVAAFDDLRLEDATGQVLWQADFETDLEPAPPPLEAWHRSDPQRCEVQSRTRHTGERALKVHLGYREPARERLNTRHGVPEDGLRVTPDQLGMFQADYPLERVRSSAPAPDQCILPPELRLEGAVAGYAAAGVVGLDQARWVPLVNAYDGYGRLRGAAGALLRHYAGPYAGSSWAFFGVTNRDLFAATSPSLRAALPALTEALVNDTYLAALEPDRGCYRPGEPVQVRATVCNGGRHTRTLDVTLEIRAGEPAAEWPTCLAPAAGPEVRVLDPSATSEVGAGRTVALLQQQIRLAPGRTNAVVFEWAAGQFATDFCHLTAHVRDGAAELDRIESGLVVWDEAVLAGGPRIEVRDNYLRLGQRPTFLFGTDDWGYVFTTARETPLQWLRDMRQRRDLGVQIYENLQFGLPATLDQRERLLRKVDGVIQLAQKYDQTYFAGLLVGYNTAAQAAELDRQTEYVRDFARRYAQVPGLIYYLNGDLRCELSDALTPEWNRFLAQRYATDADLRAAWGNHAPTQPLGQIPAADFNDWDRAWAEVKVYDLNQFRAWLIRRWCSSLIAAIRQSDPHHPTSAEFYQLPHQGVDLPAAIDGLDLANFGYFDRPGADLARFPAVSVYNDQRARGKPGGPGEYGVKTHPAWGNGGDYGYHTARSGTEARELFLGIAHYALGLGAARIHNWCWKDDAHRVFPWGMVYPCDGVPKDTAYVHRNQSLLFRQFQPVHRPATVYVLTADAHRLGGGKWTVIEGILQSIQLALAIHIDNLGTLNELDLEIPPQAKLIYYPLPYCIPEAVYAQLLEWVRAGGVLYVSGDLSYDERRQRTHLGRIEELCGVRFDSELYPNIQVRAEDPADQPAIRVQPRTAQCLRRTADGTPLVLENRVGRGRVFYSTDPLELHATEARRAVDLALYRQVLAGAGIRPLGLDPADPALHLFRVPLQDGGQVLVLFNTDTAADRRTVTLTDPTPPLTIAVARRRPALVWLGPAGEVLALEVQGACRAGDTWVAEDRTGGIILSLDGHDVRRAQALLLMPLEAGTVRWARQGRWPDPGLYTGEVRSGRWVTFHSAALVEPDDVLEIEIGAEQALSLVLLCPRAEVSRWTRAIEDAFRASLPRETP